MKYLKIVNTPTNRKSDSLSTYLNEIRKVPLLSPDEESELITKIRQGDLLSHETLIKSNLRFVVSVAKHYQHQGLSLSDLVSEGNLGLLKAAQRFDATRGFKFISYAVWWIRASIVQALAQNSRLVRLPRNNIKLAHKINSAFAALEQEYEREPTCDELASVMKTEEKKVRHSLRLKTRVVSMDTSLHESNEQCLLDIVQNHNAELPDQHISYNESLQNEIAFLLKGLRENQSKVMKMYYGLEGEEEMTHYEISRKLNVSSERVRQIKEDALRNIKNSANCEKLREFVVN